jgi:cytochrome c551
MSSVGRISFLTFLISALNIACVPGSDKSGDQSVKFQQYFVAGETLYQKHCANCHQVNGTGLGKVYPPLEKSDFMEKNFEEVVCLLKFGKKGEIWVNGSMYNQEMKGIPELTDLEVASITTYIYNSWSHKRGLVEVTETTVILNACVDRR